jgi:hypothetical protein
MEGCYNLAADIGERADLAAAQPARAASLRSVLHRWQTAVGAQKMTPNPAYRR